MVAAVVAAAADDLDQRQEIDRIVGMGDEQPLGMGEPRLQVGRQKAGGRGADQRIRRACGVDLGEHAALEIETLRHAFLHPFRVRHGVGEACAEGQTPARRQRRVGEQAVSALGIGDHLADDALRLRMRVEHVHVDAGQQKAGDPARRR